jgi:hypothetical protein
MLQTRAQWRPKLEIKKDDRPFRADARSPSSDGRGFEGLEQELRLAGCRGTLHALRHAAVGQLGDALEGEGLRPSPPGEGGEDPGLGDEQPSVAA